MIVIEENHLKKEVRNEHQFKKNTDDNYIDNKERINNDEQTKSENQEKIRVKGEGTDN